MKRLIIRRITKEHTEIVQCVVEEEAEPVGYRNYLDRKLTRHDTIKIIK